MEDETPDAFAARMKVTFDASEVPRLSTDIDVPDLPPMAPPSATNKRRMLTDFDDTLSYQLTWADWLMNELEECCNMFAESYSDIVEANMQA